MEKNEQTRNLSVELIDRAANGEREALNAVLLIYDAFLDMILAEASIEYGDLNLANNEDWKVQLQMHLADAIQEKWRKQI